MVKGKRNTNIGGKYGGRGLKGQVKKMERHARKKETEQQINFGRQGERQTQYI